MFYDTNIILFKALKTVDANSTVDQINEIFSYYVSNTHSNHLDDLLKDKKFKVITMNCNHNDWIHDDYQITKICSNIVSV